MSNFSQPLGSIGSFLDTSIIKGAIHELVANGDIQAVHILLGLFIVVLLILICIAVIECVRSFCESKRYTFQDDARV